MSGDYGAWSISDAARALRKGEVTSRLLTQAMLDSIAAIDPILRCFICLDSDAALAAADAADAEMRRGHFRGPLHGVPLAHKDIFDRPDRITTCGSQINKSPATSTATVLARLAAAGAINLGALNMDEFAAGDVGDNPYFGRCRNPWRLDHITGGSSGGSAAAVAAGLIFGSLGADTGGSVRSPAAYCGVVGLKPTYGRISRFGAAARSWSMDCIGPLARTVEDCALILQAVAGADPLDPSSSHAPVPDYSAGLHPNLKGMRVSLAQGLCMDDINPCIAQVLQDAVCAFRDLGAVTSEVTVPDLPLINDLQQVVVKCEAALSHRNNLATSSDAISDRVRSVLFEGYMIPSVHYLEALSMRAPLLERHVEDVFGEADVVLAPVNADVAPPFELMKEGNQADHARRFSHFARFTRFANYLGLPALVVPGGFTSEHLPVGLQLLARPYGEMDVLAAGHALLEAVGWHRRWRELASLLEAETPRHSKNL